MSAIFTALARVEPSDGLACLTCVLPGWPLNPGETDSEGAHGDEEGEDRPLFKGKDMEPPSGDRVMFQPGAWETLSQKCSLPAHDSQASQMELLTPQPTYCPPLDRAPPNSQLPDQKARFGSSFDHPLSSHPLSKAAVSPAPLHTPLSSSLLAPPRPTSLSHLQDLPSIPTLTAHCPREAT